jgi:ABC-type cobalamin transport system permease subunit
MKSGQVAFGLFTLIVGVGIGYFMYAYPEGLNPEWPLAMAFVVPALFVLGGVLIIADTLQQTRLAIAMIRAIIFCFWAMIHWAAFFTTHIQCRVTISFLGAKIVGWNPSEMECRNSLRVLIGGLDVLIVLAVCVFAWQRYQARRKEPGR